MPGDSGRDFHLRRAQMQQAAGDAAAVPRVRDIHYRLAELHRAAADRTPPSRADGT